MEVEVTKLINKLDAYLDDMLTLDELENFTMSLIANDKFDTLENEVQDTIYELDMHKLNKLTKKDIKQIRDALATKFNASK